MTRMESQEGVRLDSENDTMTVDKLNKESNTIIVDGNLKDMLLQDKETSNDRESTIEPTEKSEVLQPTENELIDVDDIELSDEDSWLYTSPKKLTTEQKDESLYKWLRKDVEDLDNIELQMAKKALVSKLEELDILSPQTLRKTRADAELLRKQILSKKTDNYCDTPSSSNCFTGSPRSLETTLSSKHPVDLGSTLKQNETSGSAMLTDKLLLSESRPLNNVTDVHEIARLQEESLRQSSSKFLNLSEKIPVRGQILGPDSGRKQKFLMKPASVEALHKYNGSQSPPALVSVGGSCRIVKSSPQNSPFGSTMSLEYPSDIHRSSLPNLNRGYYSLRPKKSKRPSESRIQCPLPIYPVSHQVQVNGSVSQTDLSPVAKGSGRSHSIDYRETSTLPSSYRIKSQKPPLGKKEYLPNSSLRRESAPSPLCANNMQMDRMHRREHPLNSVRSVDGCYPRRQSQMSSPTSRVMSPVSPRVNGGLITNHSQEQHGPSPTLHGSSKSPSLNNLYGAKEHSHSPSRVPPSSWTANKLDGLTSSGQKDLNKMNVPSKIPSPFMRSGIPVPSSQQKSRSSPSEDIWRDGCF